MVAATLWLILQGLQITLIKENKFLILDIFQKSEQLLKTHAHSQLDFSMADRFTVNNILFLELLSNEQKKVDHQIMLHIIHSMVGNLSYKIISSHSKFQFANFIDFIKINKQKNTYIQCIIRQPSPTHSRFIVLEFFFFYLIKTL